MKSKYYSIDRICLAEYEGVKWWHFARWHFALAVHHTLDNHTTKEFVSKNGWRVFSISDKSWPRVCTDAKQLHIGKAGSCSIFTNTRKKARDCKKQITQALDEYFDFLDRTQKSAIVSNDFVECIIQTANFKDRYFIGIQVVKQRGYNNVDFTAKNGFHIVVTQHGWVVLLDNTLFLNSAKADNPLKVEWLSFPTEIERDNFLKKITQALEEFNRKHEYTTRN